MKQLLTLWVVLISLVSFGQESSKEALYAAKGYLRDGNDAYEKKNYEEATIAYQKSLDKQGTYYKGAYNLGNAYFQQKKYKEALEQYKLAKSLAKTEGNKTKVTELIGDTNKKLKDLEGALNEYKEALLKKPKDDVLRQKYIAAKTEKQKQDQQNKDDKNKDNKDNKDDKDNKDNKDNKDDKGDKKDKEGDDKKDNKDEKDKEDKEKNKDDKGDDKKDEKGDGDKKDQDKNKGDKGKDEQPAQPKESKLNPQQIQQLLESMSNEEQKTQKKVNAQKVKVKVNKNEKDW